MSTHFQDAWLIDPHFKSWIKRVEEKPTYAYCSLCRGEFSLSNMGRQALRSHMKGKKHSERVALKGSILNYTTRSNESKESEADPKPEVEPQPASFQTPSSSSSKFEQTNINSFAIKNEVTGAEIMWCMQTVMCHKSLRSSEKDVSVMSRMFPDSSIANKMQLKKDKIGYMIMYGIAPFYKSKLMDDLKGTSFLVVGFDESLNKITKKQQMDINVRYWHKTKNSVVTRYLTSEFLGRSRAADLLIAFKKGLNGISLDKVLQVSMDGPNVNWAFLRELNLEIKENTAKLLDLGSCGLHIVHGAFKDGARASNWNIETYLRGIYNLFKDVPARRALFTHYTSSTVFPLKFCGHRWLENATVAHRGMELIPSIVKFVDGVKRDKLTPTCKSFHDVTNALADPLLLPKLAFFKSVAGELEPFLRDYQSEEPLVPFLYTDLSRTLLNLAERFMKPESLEKLSDLTEESVNDIKNHLLIKNVVVGFEVKKELAKIRNVKEKDVLQFRDECRTFLKTIVCKLLKRSPLSYALTRACSSLDPATIVSDKDIAKRRMEKLLSILTNFGRVSGAVADSANRQYRKIISESNAFDLFDKKSNRLDEFWRDLLRGENENLLTVIQIVCCLSHGNSSVERGFSVNKECLFENMMEESVVARRQVYDAISEKGGIQSVEISKPLILRVRNAHSIYLDDIKRRKKEEVNEKTAVIEKRQREAEAKALQIKRAKILEDAQREAQKIEDEINMLKK